MMFLQLGNNKPVSSEAKLQLFRRNAGPLHLILLEVVPIETSKVNLSQIPHRQHLRPHLLY